MDEDVEIKKDILAKMLARRQITLAEYMAGREWQYYLESAELQPFRCYSWEVPVGLQGLYQHQGDLSERQDHAFDVRRILELEIGSTAADDLDRILSLPQWISLRLSDAGVAYIARLLQVVSVCLDIQAGGEQFGEAAEEWEMATAERHAAELRREQPWLFEAHRLRPQKPSAAKIRGRYAR